MIAMRLYRTPSNSIKVTFLLERGYIWNQALFITRARRLIVTYSCPVTPSTDHCHPMASNTATLNTSSFVSKQASRPTVVVFRRRMLAWSETFVARQALALPTWRPVFAGISRDTSGDALLNGRECLLLNEHARVPALARLALSAAGKVSPHWYDAVAAERPHLVHAHFMSSGVAAVPLAQALDVPLVVTVHGYDVLDRKLSARDQRRRLALFDTAARITAVSDFLLERLIALGCPPEKATRHYIGTDIGLEQQTSEEQEAQRDSVPHVLFVGRLVALKGCHDALEAFARVRATLPEARMSILGDGPERAALESRAATIGGVEFQGVQPPEEVRRALSFAWVMCCPSGYSSDGGEEAFGLVFIEAQACRTPVLSYRTGGIGEAVKQGVGGYTVAPGDIDALTERLDDLLRNKALRRQLGMSGRARVVKEFNIATQGAKLERLYEDVLKNTTT